MCVWVCVCACGCARAARVAPCEARGCLDRVGGVAACLACALRALALAHYRWLLILRVELPGCSLRCLCGACDGVAVGCSSRVCAAPPGRSGVSCGRSSHACGAGGRSGCMCTRSRWGELWQRAPRVARRLGARLAWLTFYGRLRLWLVASLLLLCVRVYPCRVCVCVCARLVVAWAACSVWLPALLGPYAGAPRLALACWVAACAARGVSGRHLCCLCHACDGVAIGCSSRGKWRRLASALASPPSLWPCWRGPWLLEPCVAPAAARYVACARACASIACGCSSVCVHVSARGSWLPGPRGRCGCLPHLCFARACAAGAPGGVELPGCSPCCLCSACDGVAGGCSSRVCVAPLARSFREPRAWRCGCLSRLCGCLSAMRGVAWLFGLLGSLGWRLHGCSHLRLAASHCAGVFAWHPLLPCACVCEARGCLGRVCDVAAHLACALHALALLVGCLCRAWGHMTAVCAGGAVLGCCGRCPQAVCVWRHLAVACASHVCVAGQASCGVPAAVLSAACACACTGLAAAAIHREWCCWGAWVARPDGLIGLPGVLGFLGLPGLPSVAGLLGLIGLIGLPGLPACWLAFALQLTCLAVSLVTCSCVFASARSSSCVCVCARLVAAWAARAAWLARARTGVLGGCPRRAVKRPGCYPSCPCNACAGVAMGRSSHVRVALALAAARWLAVHAPALAWAVATRPEYAVQLGGCPCGRSTCSVGSQRVPRRSRCGSHSWWISLAFRAECVR